MDTNNKKTIKVFVYGTLKVGGLFVNDSLDSNRKSVSHAVMDNATLYNLLEAFPGVITGQGGQVKGEIHEYVDPDTVLKIMDIIEGYDRHNKEESLFLRKIGVVKNNDTGGNEEVVFYEFNEKYMPKKAKIIENGEW